MSQTDRAAAVEIAQKALNERRGFGNVQAGYAEAVVAALDEANLLRRPDEAAYVAALEAVAEAARQAHRSTTDAELDDAVDAICDAVDCLDAVPGPSPAEDAAFVELVQPGQEIERSGEACDTVFRQHPDTGMVPACPR